MIKECFQDNIGVTIDILISMSENDPADLSPARPPLPPASFEFLVMSLGTQAQIQLGLLHFGSEEEKPEPDLDMARHSIDLLGVLQEKSKGNLSLEEERLLGNTLTELRFRYIQAQKK